MARVNISVPDDLLQQAKDAGLNISSLTRHAIAEELVRRAKIAGVDRYLAELEAEQGPISEEKMAEAEAWGRRYFPNTANEQASA